MKDCSKGWSSQASQIQEEDNLGWNGHDSETGYLTLTATMEQSAILQVWEQLKVMTLEENSELASELGVREDFTSA
jgi:hypothetical protein